MTKRNTALALSVGSILALGLLAPAVADTTSKETATTSTTTTTTADPVKAADTQAEHQALADGYRKKTAAYREDAATHRQMLATYKKQVAVPTDGKTGIENPWVKKMRVHCEAYIRDADRLAADSEKFTEFHTMRAAELQGK
jgi:hypothetical protein